MSAPIRVKVEADIGSDIGSDKATQDLWRLAETDDSEQLEHILARGADINARNGDGVTALVRAAYNGRLQMVRALIDHGADLNATREDGFTPLGLAAFFGHTDVVRVLVERGADLGKATRFGTSAEMWATARSFYEIAQYLERARSSAPESSAPESSANRFGVMPTPAENEPGDKVPTAEPIRAEQPEQPVQSSLADSDLTIATPRIMFPDQLISQRLEENPETGQETGQENEHASAEPLVVRTLKAPPEIWDLVHETPGDFNPGGTFVARLTSSKTNLILLTLAVMFISGVCTFAVMKLRDDRKRGGAAAQVQEERGPSQTAPASQVSAPASAPVNGPVNAPVNAPVNTQLNTQLSTSPSAGDGVGNTPTQPTNPQPTDPQSTIQPDNPASASKALTNSIQPTGVSVNNFSKRTASLAGTAAALSGNKRVTVASGWQNADKSRPARGESETAAGSDTSAKPQTSQAPQTADLKRSDEKSSSDSASAKKRSDTTLSPQLIAPPKTSAAPKAKVIQWP